LVAGAGRGCRVGVVAGGETPEDTGISAPSKARECPEKPGDPGVFRGSGLLPARAERTTRRCGARAARAAGDVDGCLRLFTFVDV
jgi:hypothetical protein